MSAFFSVTRASGNDRSFVVLAAAFCCLMSLVVPLRANALTTSEGLSGKDVRHQWHGDYEEMTRNRVIRALVPYSKTFYFLDGARQRGLTYELLQEFEKFVNKREKSGALRIRVLVIPTSRDRLFADLQAGIGDIAAGNLTITRARSKLVDFSDPFARNIDEIVVTGKNEPPPSNLFDLSGREVFVRRSSSYYESLTELNRGLARMGREPARIREAAEYLEDEDILELVNVGVVPAMIIDAHKGRFWAGVFQNIRLYPDIKVNTGGEIAWAIRKNSPGLKSVINEFVKKHKKGTLIGNILIKRYLKNTDYVKNSVSGTELQKFKQVVGLFRKYGGRYDFDWLMLGALAYQESQLDHSRRSRAGAIGIMQVLPSTAADPNVGIPDIGNLEKNIHAGTKYLRFMINRYFAGEQMDSLNKGLFAFASYNAGPGRIARLRKLAVREGLDPNVWFNNVEIMAARHIGRETVQYVANIYKYYVAYKLMVERGLLRPDKQGTTP